MIKLYTGNVCDVLSQKVELESVHTVVTSPPYWQMRLYAPEDSADRHLEIGQEKTPEEYIDKLVAVFDGVRKYLRNDGTLWLNLGDCRTGGGRNKNNSNTLSAKQASNRGSLINPVPVVKDLGSKQLLGLPWRVALALQKDGWILRSDIIWYVPNKMPESVRDRPSKAHEYIFLLSKRRSYYYDAYSVIDDQPNKLAEYSNTSRFNGFDGKPLVSQCNLRDVWRIPTHSYKGAHFATFPPSLVTPCILSGTSEFGCCKSCGSPYQRVIKSVRMPTRPGVNTKISSTHRFGLDTMKQNSVAIDHSRVGNRDPLRHISVKEHAGWSKTCKCSDTEIKPCTVMDPFSGSGTTGLVAKRLGRSYIGIDLYEANTQLALDRINES